MPHAARPRYSLSIRLYGQTSFVIGERSLPLAGRIGTVYIQSNTSGGNAFSSIPIMSWSGMFQ
jgi:hypothetical protein